MESKERKPRITKKKNGEIVILKNWELPVTLVENLKKKAKNDGVSENFLVRKALKDMLLYELSKNL